MPARRKFFARYPWSDGGKGSILTPTFDLPPPELFCSSYEPGVIVTEN